MGFITAQRNQLRMFGYSLDDFVAPDAKCRFVVEIVAELDLRELYADYSPQGGDAYDPRALLAAWFFAYSEGVSSTRRLEQMCLRDMHYIYVSGNLGPDHTTLSRFRQRHAQRLPDYFVQIIRVARERGVSEFKHVSIDGTRMHAASSARQNRDARALEKELEGTREQIREYLERSELLDEEEGEAEDLAGVREKLERLSALEKKLVERRGQLEQRRKGLDGKYAQRHKINLVEPDARNMNESKSRGAVPAYNAQVSVDSQSQLIVAAEVTDEATDQNLFSEQHRQVEENLGADPKRRYTADAGYHSLKQLEYIEDNKVDAVVAEPRTDMRQGGGGQGEQKGFRRADFRYDEKSDEYECPAGRRLSYWYTENKRGRRVKVYRASSCGACEHRAVCIKGQKKYGTRTIMRDEKEELAEEMFQKASSEQGRDRLKARATSVEPVIGNLKSNLGFRRFRLRGKQKAGAEFILMCIAHIIHHNQTLCK